MSLSSDEIIKRQIIDELGYKFGNIRLRVFPESSNEDQVLFSEGGLTFGYNQVMYGSCDAAWYLNDKEYIDGYDNKKTQTYPVIALEGTDALQRGSSGNAQYQRFHHALGAVKNGIIGIYYLKPGKHTIQPDLYGMAYYASKYENGYYLIIQDLTIVKDILELINNYGVFSNKLTSYLDNYLEEMYSIFYEAFKLKYNANWDNFATKRSTIKLDNKVVKHAGRMLRNFTESSQRAGHIAVGEMYLTKYYFFEYEFYYLFPKMTAKEVEYLNKTKGNDKEWHLLSNEPNVHIKTMDNLLGLPIEIKRELLEIKDEPLKGNTLKKYNALVKEIIQLIQDGKINFD